MPQTRSRRSNESSGPPGQHPLVTLLNADDGISPSSVFPTAGDKEDLVSFVGFVNGLITRPGTDTEWLLMYLDAQLQQWLLLEGSKIVKSGTMVNEAAPVAPRSVVWVQPTAAVGKGEGRQSDEARFLTGEFTRAADFEAAPAGGTMAASTGVFCGGNTAFCCRRPSQSGGG